MRYAKALLPTLKEAPSDATAESHILLTRAGYMRQVGAGIYTFLPLGLRVLRNIEAIVREEMNRTGAQELLLPALLPADYFRESGRWDTFGDTLLRLKDRKGADYHLGPTHEEIITDLARREIQSYRDLPQNLYQIQTKFRDEARPRGGLLRGREFLMKDAYSFDVSEDAALTSYETMRVAYRRIFDRLGLDYRMVGADSGAMGGSKSAEFQVLVQSGEDLLMACKSCQFAENLEVASPPLPQSKQLATVAPVEKIHTPGKGGIDIVAEFLKASKDRFLKSLVYSAGTELILAVVCGDHEVNPIKLARAAGVAEVHLASSEDVRKATGASVGYAGPIGFKGKVFIDPAATQIDDAITGANETDHHLIHVQHGRDFSGDIVPLRLMTVSDPCPSCGGDVAQFRGIEAGHIFVLGTHYSAKMGATFLNEKGEKQTLVMGCYGIGVSRLVAAIVEQHRDANGISWPLAAAPYKVHVCQLGEGPEVVAAVAQIESELLAAGIEPLVDDRDIRPGVKFKDADLIGLPYRITVGDRGLSNGKVELKARTETNPKASEEFALSAISPVVIERIKKELSDS